MTSLVVLLYNFATITITWLTTNRNQQGRINLIQIIVLSFNRKLDLFTSAIISAPITWIGFLRENLRLVGHELSTPKFVLFKK